jgi:hypothetical protein
MVYFEVVFDITYLISVIFLSSLIVKKGLEKKVKAIIIFGIMGLLLGFGDSFHLIPRIIAQLTTGMDDYALYLGVGKLITGITMTIFYYLLYQFYILKTDDRNSNIHISIIFLILVRFILLALPGNEWTLNSNILLFGIIRNIPFALLGGIIVYLFLTNNNEKEKVLFSKIGIWVIVSFVCYGIVVIGSGFIPILGALMMPKTVAYFIIIYLGYKDTVNYHKTIG